MTGLAEVVRALAARDGIELVALVSGDGLPIDVAGARSADGDAVAALAGTLLRQAERLGQALAQPEPRTVLVEYEQGAVVIAPLGDGHALLVQARADADLGQLLYDLRRHRPAVTALL